MSRLARLAATLALHALEHALRALATFTDRPPDDPWRPDQNWDRKP